MESSRVKIAHVLHSVGGVDVSLRLIVENLNSNKFENIVIHGKKDTQKPFLDSKKNIIRNYRTTIFRDIYIVEDIKSIIDTYRILKKERPQIIHAHSAKGGVVGRIVGKLLNIKVYYTPQAFSYLSTQNKFKKQLFLFIEKLLRFDNCYILAASNSEKNRAINEVCYKSEKVLLFNNCINPIQISSQMKIVKNWPDEYICTVGRPSYQKNIELMIEVLFEINKIQNLHLVIMGVGHHVGQLESVKNLIIKLNMSNKVTLLEWTERNDVFNIISKSKLYISTARYEGLPYSIIESLALSKPCVVSNCDGNVDIIKDGYNGNVITNGSILSYKNKITKLLNDEKQLKEYSENAYQTFCNHFDITKKIQELESIYLSEL